MAPPSCRHGEIFPLVNESRMLSHKSYFQKKQLTIFGYMSLFTVVIIRLSNLKF